MAVDRASGDELEEISDRPREKVPEQARSDADFAAARREVGETRTPAEYYLALRAAVDQQQRAFDEARQPADTRSQSAWDSVAAATRPPLDALRIPIERATHILDGDATGGGHRHGTGSPGKTEFPAHWDDDAILKAIVTVASSPENVHQQWNKRWKARGEVNDVLINVIVETDGAIWTAWPEEGGPGVVRNPKAGSP